MRVTGLTAPGVFDGAIDGESFRAYIEQILVPTLHPGDIVMADNLGAHKVAGIQRAIQAALLHEDPAGVRRFGLHFS